MLLLSAVCVCVCVCAPEWSMHSQQLVRLSQDFKACFSPPPPNNLPPGQTLPAGGRAELRQRPSAARNLPNNHPRQDLREKYQEITVKPSKPHSLSHIYPWPLTSHCKPQPLCSSRKYSTCCITCLNGAGDELHAAKVLELNIYRKD